ncbi:hypothetical protein JYG30_01725 [Fibrella sp. USSR17]
MWIASTLGFFSVVKSSRDGNFMIRARRAADLQNLTQAGLVGTYLETPEADYIARLIVTPNELPRFYTMLAQTVDYHNFKGKIHDLPDQANKLGMYGNMWSAAYAYQQQVREAEAADWGEAISLDEVAEQTDGGDYQAKAYRRWKQLQAKTKE